MALLTPSAWTTKYFAEGSRPAEVTVRKWVRTGVVPARKIGGNWYIDEVAWLAENDPLVEMVLKAG